jgi:hypothetical protein
MIRTSNPPPTPNARAAIARGQLGPNKPPGPISSTQRVPRERARPPKVRRAVEQRQARRLRLERRQIGLAAKVQFLVRHMPNHIATRY